MLSTSKYTFEETEAKVPLAGEGDYHVVVPNLDQTFRKLEFWKPSHRKSVSNNNEGNHEAGLVLGPAYLACLQMTPLFWVDGIKDMMGSWNGSL